MHVLVAIACTFSWIFLCAGLFQLWEEWSYWDSLYFMFISLLTIGLGDVNVQRRDLMMLCFIFVMIGLSLVSMCIMVIQLSLEDFYKKMIVKVVTDYQIKIDRNQRRSSMASIIKNNGKDKYLIPMKKCIFQMVPQSTKRHVLEEVEEEARESGIKLPPSLKNHNTVDQIIFDDKKDFSDIYEDTPVIVINGILKQEPSLKEQHKDTESPQNLIYHNIQKKLESCTQTYGTQIRESCVQTNPSTEVRGVQTTILLEDLARQKKHNDKYEIMVDAAIQTDRLRLSFKKLQIRSRRSDAETMITKDLGQIMNAKSQTDKNHFTGDQEIQTWIPFELVDLYEKDTQTYRFMKSQRIQTPKPLLNDAQTQSHNSDLNGQIYPSVSMLKMFLNPIDNNTDIA
nr:unnamed protein product [Meloidogyne enterolobii]